MTKNFIHKNILWGEGSQKIHKQGIIQNHRAASGRTKKGTQKGKRAPCLVSDLINILKKNHEAGQHKTTRF